MNLTSKILISLWRCLDSTSPLSTWYRYATLPGCVCVCVCVRACVCVCVFISFHCKGLYFHFFKGFFHCKQNNKCNARDQASDVVLRKLLCVKHLCRHIIDNHSRDLQASNCARVSIKPGRATRSNLGSRPATAQRRTVTKWTANT